MNFIFVSPHFPKTYWNFCDRLHRNGVNVLAMGAFYVAPQMGCDIADAYLNAELGSGYEWWKNFYEFHKLAIDELEAFDYEEYKKNGFKMKHLGDYPLSLETKDDLHFQLRGDD